MVLLARAARLAARCALEFTCWSSMVLDAVAPAREVLTVQDTYSRVSYLKLRTEEKGPVGT